MGIDGVAPASVVGAGKINGAREGDQGAGRGVAGTSQLRYTPIIAYSNKG